MSAADPAQKERVRAISVSLTGGIFILGLKAAAYWMTGSMALKSDALEGLVNIAAAAFGLGAVIFAGRPADDNHPYGHGKIEYLAAAFEGGLISLAAVLIAYESAFALWRGVELRSLGAGMTINLVAGALNGLLGWWLIREGRRLSSKTIEADGQHVLSDFMTTLGIFAGLLLVKTTGLSWLDPLVALAVAVLLGRAGARLVREAASGLLDEEDAPTIGTILGGLNGLLSEPVDDTGVITVHGLRAIRSGRYTHVDLHIVVPEYLPVSESHDDVERFESRLISRSGLEGELHAHMDPCRRKYCGSCSDSACPIRLQPYAGRPALRREEATRAEPAD